MKISVKPGDVFVASVNVKRHSGGFYTIQIATPSEARPGTRYFPEWKNAPSALLHSYNATNRIQLFEEASWSSNFTEIVITPESNDEEEALLNGLFDVLDCYSRYSVTLIAIPASLLEESEEAGMWEPQGNVDYLT